MNKLLTSQTGKHQTHFTTPITLLVREGVGQYRVPTPDEVLFSAWALLAEQVKPGRTLGTPQDVQDYLRLEIGPLECEVFGAVFLDAQHRIIDLRNIFRGTVSETSVYPREIVKESLACNAAALILFHNHPSGLAEPSRADEYITQTLKSALALVDVRVLDHLIVGQTQVVSMAERGLV